MKVCFIGATHEVTGSCTLLQCGEIHGLVDCGMEQGKDTFQNQEIPVQAMNLDFVLLTHAHIDHSGLLPLLCKNGFRGRIYATEETADLCRIMLMDSAHIQVQEAEWKARKAKRAGDDAGEPLYDLEDAQLAISRLRPCCLGARLQIAEGVFCRFVNAGHLLGSASIEIWLTEGEKTRKIVFSGDLGNHDLPIIREKDYVQSADYVVIESTYGDRLHPPADDPLDFLAEVIQRTLDRGGNLVIPAFAVGRTQEMLYLIRELKQKEKIQGHDGFKVYVDSPLAIEATGIFLQCDESSLDDETRNLVRSGVNPLMFPGLEIAQSSDESKLINFNSEPKVIISASGMCEAGRIRHHLKHNLWRKESTILFVGYQAGGTLGRTLLDGNVSTVRLFGEEISVQAEIVNMPGKSGHADQAGLLEWLQAFQEKPRHIFVNHGEDAVASGFAGYIQEKLSLHASAPYSGAEFNLLTGRYEYQPEGVAIVKGQQTPAAARKKAVYGKLLQAVARLNALVPTVSGCSNKEIARWVDMISKVCDKME